MQKLLELRESLQSVLSMLEVLESGELRGDKDRTQTTLECIEFDLQQALDNVQEQLAIVEES